MDKYYQLSEHDKERLEKKIDKVEQSTVAREQAIRHLRERLSLGYPVIEVDLMSVPEVKADCYRCEHGNSMLRICGIGRVYGEVCEDYYSKTDEVFRQAREKLANGLGQVPFV